MSGPAETKARGDNSFEYIILETFQKSPRSVPMGKKAKSQIVDARDQ